MNVQAAARVVAAAVAAQVHGALARRASGGGAVERRSAPARASRVPRAGHAPPRRGASLISAPLRLRKEPATHYVLHCESPSVPEPSPRCQARSSWAGRAFCRDLRGGVGGCLERRRRLPPRPLRPGACCGESGSPRGSKRRCLLSFFATLIGHVAF